jgi:hypothetical protein
LYYQLNERISFIQPKDKIIAALLFELGNVSYLTGAKAEASTLYEKAKEYGFENSLLKSREELLVHERSQRLERIAKARLHQRLLWGSIILLGIALLIAIVVRLKRKKNSS